MNLRVLIVVLAVAMCVATALPSSVEAEDDWLEVRLTVQDATGLAAYEANIVFDPQVVRLGDIEPGALIPAESSPLGPVGAGSGTVLLGSFNLAGNTSSGSGELGVLYFEVLGDGDPGFALIAGGTGAFDTFGRRLDGVVRMTVGSKGESYLPFLASDQR